jgi:hypothetical protein
LFEVSGDSLRTWGRRTYTAARNWVTVLVQAAASRRATWRRAKQSIDCGAHRNRLNTSSWSPLPNYLLYKSGLCKRRSSNPPRGEFTQPTQPNLPLTPKLTGRRWYCRFLQGIVSDQASLLAHTRTAHPVANHSADSAISEIPDLASIQQCRPCSSSSV